MASPVERTIRRITIGTDPMTGMAYNVGQVFMKGAIQVTDIVVDPYTAEKYNLKRYDIYVSKTNDAKKEAYLWKSFENVPVALEYQMD